MKIVAIVSMNDRPAYVLDEDIEYVYTKYPGGLLIGTDPSKTFYQVLYYERPVGRFKAFAGREFDLKMSDGTVTHCNGQYWDGHYRQAEEALGFRLVGASYQSVDSLRRCYVFTGSAADENRLSDLVAEFEATHPDYAIWDYYEYELHLKKGGQN